jgi:hypothetical protein
VQSLSVRTSTREPAGYGRLLEAENTFTSGSVQPFGECREHHCDLLRGSFKPVQWTVASSTERGVAGLTTKRLDPLSMTVLPIADESMDVSVSDSKLGALLVRTGEALGGYPPGCSPAAFHLSPRSHRSRRCASTRRGSGVQTTGGAIVWAAGLEETVERAVLGPSS